MHFTHNCSSFQMVTQLILQLVARRTIQLWGEEPEVGEGNGGGKRKKEMEEGEKKTGEEGGGE